MTSRGMHLGAVIAALLACGAPAGAAPAASARPVPATRPAPADDPMLYVANQLPATVSVIDAKTNTLVTTVDLQKLGFSAKAKPHDIAVEPDGSFWYVSLIGDGYVVKFDRQNRVVGKAAMAVPGLLALDPHSDLLYATRSMSAVNPPSSIGVIHRGTMSVDEVDVFVGRPHAVAVDPRGTFAYVGSLAENQIATVNGSTEQVTLSPIPGDSNRMIVDFAVNPDGTRLVGTDQMQNQALVFDAGTPTKLTQLKAIDVPAWPWHVAFTPDGNQVWFGNQKDNSVTELDAGTWTVGGIVRGTGLAAPHGVAVSPDGRTVYISSHNLQGTYQPRSAHTGGTGTVVAIDRATRAISKVIETDVDPVGMNISGSP